MGLPTTASGCWLRAMHTVLVSRYAYSAAVDVACSLHVCKPEEHRSVGLLLFFLHLRLSLTYECLYISCFAIWFN